MHTQANPKLGPLPSVRRASIALLMLVCGSADAQEPRSVDGTYLVGARVRYSLEDTPRRWRHATITAYQGDTLYLDDPWRPKVATASLSRLQLSSGRSHLKGLGRGFLVGGGIGAVAGWSLGAMEEENGEFYFGPQLLALGLGAFGGGVGALIGGAVGVRQWLPEVDVTSFRRGPQRVRGARVGWSLAF